MLDIKKIGENIIICGEMAKNRILDLLYKEKQIPPFKIMNLDEFIKKITFDYDTKTIHYLMRKYNLSYTNVITYIKNLYYVDDVNYNFEKLQYLVNLKKELTENNLLITDELFKESIKNKTIFFYNINTDYKFMDKLLNGIKYEIITDEEKKNYSKPIFFFEKIEDEINFVAEQICSLIENNADIDHIKLVNVTSEYTFLIEHIFNSYGLKLDNTRGYLFSTMIGKSFLDNLSENISDTIKTLRQKFALDEETEENIDKIVDICNKYTWCQNFLEIKDMLEYELKNTQVFNKKYSSVIKMVDIDNIDNDDYAFLLGFNQENIPKIYKDDEYITDNMKKEIGIETSSEKNKRIREYLVRKILSLKNLKITYKKKTNFNEFYLSSLNDYLNFEIVNPEKSYSEVYSEMALKVELCKQLDEFLKYGVKTQALSLLFSNLNNLLYKKYDNNYNGINKNDLIDYLDKKLLLSYSSIDNYYKCKFKFYINNILKLDPFQENFKAFLGSLIHHMLQTCFTDNFNYDKEYHDYIVNSGYNFTPKDKFFLKRTKDELKKVIDIINKQKLLTNFNKELYEQKIYIEKSNNIKITFMGIIDKIMYMEKDGKNYLAIVDYKTGYIKTDLKYVEHGLNLQLPIYAYLIKKSNLFSNPVISGLYYQKIINSEIPATTKEKYEQGKYDNLKLIGLSTTDETILEQFDSSYKDSELISSMKLTKDGSFSKNSKLFTDTELNDLLNITENKIDEAIQGIQNGDFEINPKQIKRDNISCEFCKYKDLCYMTENNKQIIEDGD